MTRSWNVSRNALVGIVCQVITLVLSFVVRTVFAYALSEEYLGITGLFTNVLTILNLSELGLSSAIVFALYKPIADDDRGKICSLMLFYRKAYWLIGGIFLVIGIFLIPFLPALLKGNTTLVNVTMVYCLYLLQMVTSYWFFAYRSALLTASQNEYIITVVSCLCNLGLSIVQCIVLLLFNENPSTAFYLYVGSGVLFNILMNAIISAYVGKHFPYIKEKENIKGLPSDEKKDIFKNVFGLSLYKFSAAANSSVGTIIISSFISVSSAGVYSNYLLINTGITRMMGVVFNPLTASIGNLNATEGNAKNEFIFNCLNLVYFWIYGFCGICMWILFNPFVGGIWLGTEWLLADAVVIAMVFKFIIDGFLGAVIKYREAAGLFWNTRVRYILTTVVNLFFSILFVWRMEMGILGILIGAILAEIVVVIIDPIIVFKNIFMKKPWRFYFKYLLMLILFVGTAFFVQALCTLVNMYTIPGFMIGALICLLVPNVLWYLIFRKTDEILYLKSVLRGFWSRLQKRIVKRG